MDSTASYTAAESGVGDYGELAVVERSGFVESRHFGSLIALAADGNVAGEFGSPYDVMLPRSSVKPIQALTCLAVGADLTGPALAIAAGSHTGQDEHVRVVREVLRASGLDEDDLGCPADMPSNAETRQRMVRDGDEPSRVRMNCSGKHAAMLAACVAAGWPTATYLDPHHPLQQQIRQTLAERAGEAVAHTAVDGCGAPLLGISLVGLARAVRSVVVDEPGSHGRRVADAMREHPFYVGGSGQANTVVMETLPGVLCKGGAEGVIVAVTGSGAAVAIKTIDGSPRATTAVLLAALRALGEKVAPAADLLTVPVLGGGRPVGEIRASAQVAAAVRTGP